MQNLDVDKTAAAWSSLAGKIYVPHSEEEYHQLVVLLDSMIDEVGDCSCSCNCRRLAFPQAYFFKFQQLEERKHNSWYGSARKQ